MNWITNKSVKKYITQRKKILKNVENKNRKISREYNKLLVLQLRLLRPLWQYFSTSESQRLKAIHYQKMR